MQLDYCLAEAGVKLRTIDLVARSTTSRSSVRAAARNYLAFAPRGFESFRMAIPVWLREKLFLKDLLQKQLVRKRPDFDWDRSGSCSASTT